MDDSSPSTLWKLTIAPYGKTDPEADSFAFCRERSIVGVGWTFDSRPRHWSEVEAAFWATNWATKPRSYPRALRIFSERVKEGDHVWVYDKDDRTYYVCHVTGGWQYKQGSPWDEHDIHNFFPAIWRAVRQDLVPGIVRRRMTMPGAAMIITDDEHWCRYSQLVFEEGNDLPSEVDSDRLRALAIRLASLAPTEVFRVLDQDETEDLVGLFLQEQGWRMLKSSSYRSQRDVECIMRRAVDGEGETCAYQVKSGETITINSKDYEHLHNLGTIFVFSTATGRDPYAGVTDRVIPIPQVEIRDFLADNLALLLPATQLKLALWALML